METAKAILDRIEDGKHAVLLIGEQEVEEIVDVKDLPDEAKEGTSLKLTRADDRILSIEVDVSETNERQERLSHKMAKLRQKKGGRFK